MSGRRVVLVYGPPCGGKSTYVSQHASPGDVVLDFDVIAQQCGSAQQWKHGPQITAVAEQVMRTKMRALQDMAAGTAWVIRTAPTKAARREAEQLCGATETIAVIPTQRECIERARRDRRPQGTEQSIKRWYAMHN